MPIQPLIQRLCLTFIAFCLTLLLSSCGCYQLCPISPSAETWLCNIHLDSRAWTRCADSWFFDGRPNSIERRILHSSPDRPATFMNVRVPDFDKIIVNGSFQVQIVGGQAHNSLYVLGSNPLARQVSVRVCNGTLYLIQPTTPATIHYKTIVRIGVRDLKSITQLGCGDIYGRYICSSGLSIFSAGMGNIIMSGSMNLTRIKQIGTGKITLLGVNAPCFDLTVLGNGHVNIEGRVGVKSIIHRGNGLVNILGADTNQLCILTSGCGITTVVGTANLKKVISINTSRVYLYWVNSPETWVYAADQARIHLAGKTHVLHINLKNMAEFKGQFLQSDEIFVRTDNFSHANLATHYQLFAEAKSHSSIYYFGHPSQFSRFTSGLGIIIPVPEVPCPCSPS